MPRDLFAGIPVTDYVAALEWYERLFGSPPSFVPTEREAVWELAEHRFVFIEQRPEHAGHGSRIELWFKTPAEDHRWDRFSVTRDELAARIAALMDAAPTEKEIVAPAKSLGLRLVGQF